ncbi:hypothetical protein YC2023_071369 [Brassica napus]
MSFRKCTNEPSLYRNNEGGDFLLIVIYVDDLFVTEISLKVIKQFKEEMSKRFKMSYLGKLTYCFGIEVIQGANRIRITQERYSQGILCDTKMEAYNATQVSTESSLMMSKAEDEPKIDANTYIRTRMSKVPTSYKIRSILLSWCSKSIYEKSEKVSLTSYQEYTKVCNMDYKLQYVLHEGRNKKNR